MISVEPFEAYRLQPDEVVASRVVGIQPVSGEPGAFEFICLNIGRDGWAFVSTQRYALTHKPKPKISEWERVTITGSDIGGRGEDGSDLVLTLQTCDDETVTDKITLEDRIDGQQRDGQARFARLRKACGVYEIEEAGELIGLSFERRTIDGAPEYRAITKHSA
jgi:hypothetical protein